MPRGAPRMAFSLRNETVEAEASFPLEWEEAHCPLCDGTSWSPKLEAPEPAPGGRWFLVVQCHACGLCFTNPRPTARSQRRLYTGRVDLRLSPAKESWWHRLRRDPLRRWLPVHGGARLLDV